MTSEKSIMADVRGVELVGGWKKKDAPKESGTGVSGVGTRSGGRNGEECINTSTQFVSQRIWEESISRGWKLGIQPSQH
jgi:hypothetical protein